LCLMASCTDCIPRSVWSVALETYHGSSAIILRILDWLLWIIAMLDLLEHPHNSRPYDQIGPPPPNTSLERYLRRPVP
jgi:hypothetical protein